MSSRRYTSLSESIGVSEFAKAVGKTGQTLRNWDSAGVLTPYRITPGGHRIYSREQVEEVLKLRRKKEKHVTQVVFIWADGAEELTRQFRIAVGNIEPTPKNAYIIAGVRDEREEYLKSLVQNFRKQHVHDIDVLVITSLQPLNGPVFVGLAEKLLGENGLNDIYMDIRSDCDMA